MFDDQIAIGVVYVCLPFDGLNSEERTIAIPIYEFKAVSVDPQCNPYGVNEGRVLTVWDRPGLRHSSYDAGEWRRVAFVRREDKMPLELLRAPWDFERGEPPQSLDPMRPIGDMLPDPVIKDGEAA